MQPDEWKNRIIEFANSVFDPQYPVVLTGDWLGILVSIEAAVRDARADWDMGARGQQNLNPNIKPRSGEPFCE